MKDAVKIDGVVGIVPVSPLEKLVERTEDGVEDKLKS